MDTQESKIYNLFLISAAVLLGILLYYLFNVLRLQGVNRRDFLSRLGRQLSILEQHQKKLSENLHDDMGPLVTAAKMHLTSITPLMKDKENMQKAIQLLSQLNTHMRALPKQIFPNILEPKGLERALEDMVYNVTSPAAPTITLDMERLPNFTYSRSLLIYRVLQEIIHNTCKHADASQLHIKLYVDSEFLIIATADNGIGFNYNDAMLSPSGTGLTGMLSRVHVLDGTLEVDHEAGIGARYYIRIPISNKLEV